MFNLARMSEAMLEGDGGRASARAGRRHGGKADQEELLKDPATRSVGVGLVWQEDRAII